MQGRIIALDGQSGLIETPLGNAFPFAVDSILGSRRAVRIGARVDFLVDEGMAVDVEAVEDVRSSWLALASTVFAVR
jgi:hypothetical protein